MKSAELGMKKERGEGGASDGEGVEGVVAEVKLARNEGAGWRSRRAPVFANPLDSTLSGPLPCES